MKRIRKQALAITFPVIILVVCHTCALVQDVLTERLLEQNIDFSGQSSALDYFEEITSRPVVVNTANFEKLLQIPGITPEQPGRILSYRSDGGIFTDMPAVQRVA
jgi:DNA uptake protein ComE-like DNA-binding protein